MTDARQRLQQLSPAERARLAHRASRARRERTARPAAFTEDADARYESFPLSPLQQAYLMGRGRDFDLGGVPSCAYFELECNALDPARLNAAWNAVIDHHDMLRLVVDADGTQRTLPRNPGYTIAQSVCPADPEAQITRTREDMLGSTRPSSEWPLFEMRVTHLAGAVDRVHVCFDLLGLDAGSIARVMRDLVAAYSHPGVTLPSAGPTFRDCATHNRALRSAGAHDDDRRFWLDRLSTLPPAPPLPTARPPASIEQVRFRRHSTHLDPTTSARVRDRAREIGVSENAVLLAAYGEVLARWSGRSALTVNLPVFNRAPIHAEIEATVGAFTSVCLVALDFSEPATFAERCRATQAALLEALTHRAFDGVEVQRELARKRGPNAAAMPVVFTTLIDHGFQDAVGELGRVVWAVNQTAQVWTDLHVDRDGDRLLFKWDEAVDLFPLGLVPAMLGAYVRWIEAFAAGADGVELMPPEQIERRRHMNDTAAPFPDESALAAIERAAHDAPDQLAVIDSDSRLTYAELLRAARAIATVVGPAPPDPAPVAIMIDKGAAQVPAVLGVLMTGAPYVPVDPDWPKARRAAVILDSGAITLVTTRNTRDRLGAGGAPESVRTVLTDDCTDADAFQPFPIDSGALAYVLYTSGSSGSPKGAMIEHRSIVNRMTEVRERFRLGRDDRIIAVTALHHDLSVFDLFAGLAAGATLIVPSHAARRDPAHWTDLIEREKVTVWNSVPAFMTMLVEYLDHSRRNASSLRAVMLSGDWVPVTLPDRIRKHAPRVQVTSLGGPTETTVWDIAYPVDRVDPAWTSIPYGRPLANATYSVLDARAQECPDWVTGEMYIGGAGLARGYWRDPHRTRDRFVVHPTTGARVYRSGDLGRLRPDGQIEFMGRADLQIKIAGQRIELGEIESTLREHPGVAVAAAAVHGDRHGPRRLAGYVTPTPNQTVDIDDLRTFLAERLPAHMVPLDLVVLASLPLTPNGKVDRTALPEPEAAGAVAPAGAATGNDRIAALARDVLGIPDLEATTSFLAAGADSIALVRLGNRLEEAFGQRPRIDELFRLDNIAALTAYYARQADPDPGTATALDPDDPSAIVASFRVLLDPDERDAFKNGMPGVRRDLARAARVALPRPDDASLRAAAARRQSSRRFALAPIPAEAFGNWLSALAAIMIDGKPKFRYASAGSLYPDQLYLHVQPGRVEGVAAGTWYYHPVQHALVELEPGAPVSRDIHVPLINTPIFDEAAFSLYIVAELAAVAPGYGEHSMRFATIEAGLIAHLLEEEAARHGIGLCNIGSVDFDDLRRSLRLQRTQILVHTMLGGSLEPKLTSELPASDAAARRVRMTERVARLTPAQTQALLAARPPASGPTA